MARRVFFSFHYEQDVWRSSIVRNSWMTHPDREASGFWDASLWEATKLRGDAAIQRLIDGGLEYTSVTAVLIGSETADRRWVQYELNESYKRGNGLLGIYIHNIKDQNGWTSLKGPDPFTRVYVGQGIRPIFLYDWVGDGGYWNLGSWVEEAARRAGR